MTFGVMVLFSHLNPNSNFNTGRLIGEKLKLIRSNTHFRRTNMAHQYTASAAVKPDSLVSIEIEGLEGMTSGPPKEFGGSGNEWSPEDLLVAAVADCFVLSFKAISAASKYEWVDLSCEVTGTLDKVERATQFTALNIKATLKVTGDSDVERAKRLLEKSEQTCFITNSLKADPELEVDIQVV